MGRDNYHITQQEATPNHTVVGVRNTPIDSQGEILQNSYENNNIDDDKNINNMVVWSTQEKKYLVTIDKEERQHGRGFMDRVKRRWDMEYPEKRYYSAKYLRNNASRFSKEILEGGKNDSSVNMETKNTEWNVEMKVKLVQLEKEARSEGRGYMKRMKEKWDEEYPEQDLTAQCLRDNVARFKKDSTIMNLVLVRSRNNVEQLHGSVDENDEDQSAVEEERVREEVINFNNDETLNKEEDIELKVLFENELSKLERSTQEHMEERERLLKIKIENNTKQSANRILLGYANQLATFPEIIDHVYAMARAVEIKAGVKRNVTREAKGKGENRRIRKLKKQIKALRQVVARTANKCAGPDDG